jgi:hypothetical protein
MSVSETRSWLLSSVENSHQLPCTSLRPTWTLLMKLFFCVVKRRGSAQIDAESGRPDQIER